MKIYSEQQEEGQMENNTRVFDFTFGGKYPKFKCDRSLYKYRSTKDFELLSKFCYFKEKEKLFKRWKTLYFAPPSKFNDPYDCRLPNVLKESRKARIRILGHSPDTYPYSTVPEWEMCRNISYIRSKLANKDFKLSLDEWDTSLSEILKRLHNEAAESLRNVVKVCALSEDGGSILMWSHYSNDHRGICFEYSKERLHEVLEELSVGLDKTLYPVLYKKDITMYRDMCRKLHDGELSQEELLEVAFLIATIKADVWSYEKEWRAVLQSDPDFSSTEGVTISILPSCIYLGYKISKKHEKIVCQFAKKHDIPVMKMDLNEYEFSLIPKPVDLSKM